MKQPLFLTALCLSLVGATAYSADACPWAGGDYTFRDSGIDGTFTVNGDCTQLVWSRLSEPETTALTRSKHGWVGNLTKVKVELLENGRNLRVTGDGGAMRQSNATRNN